MTTQTLPKISTGLSHARFVEIARQAANGELTESPYDEADYVSSTGINLRRLEKWHERMELLPGLMNAIAATSEKQNWVLINEPWCLDGSFAQPLFQKIAEASNGRIQLSILLRDKHPDVMDRFLTNGGRAIPKLISLNELNEVMWTWGPRPAELQQIVTEMMGRPDFDSNEKIKTVTRWFIKDKGRSVQKELLHLISNH